MYGAWSWKNEMYDPCMIPVCPGVALSIYNRLYILENGIYIYTRKWYIYTRKWLYILENGYIY